MKKILTVFLMLAALGASCPARADYEETFATGREWIKRMSEREKFISLLPPTLLFNVYDVHLRHSLPEYVHWMDKILARNPQLEREDISNLFASTIYLFEPENREALRTMETDFLRGDYEPHALQVPRLSIEEVLQEIAPEN
jgi:hypothetical protein